jgi:hypothetical protein
MKTAAELYTLQATAFESNADAFQIIASAFDNARMTNDDERMGLDENGSEFADLWSRNIQSCAAFSPSKGGRDWIEAAGIAF